MNIILLKNVKIKIKKGNCRDAPLCSSEDAHTPSSRSACRAFGHVRGIAFVHRHYLMESAKRKRSYRKTQVLIVSRRSKGFSRKFYGWKCKMRYSFRGDGFYNLSNTKSPQPDLFVKPSGSVKKYTHSKIFHTKSPSPLYISLKKQYYKSKRSAYRFYWEVSQWKS